ncbi:hypothetical protein QBC38DRAFT_523080 [Podospora fimiseda]|uniref:GPI anchored protein n=1 Tax=Podospora fimiseda TaxID=252190 RepID=A0AAN7H0X5_9PEZI|nr:hypothetical protein QBC38DRAFT_523080 [Podospora fimiseda]
MRPLPLTLSLWALLPPSVLSTQPTAIRKMPPNNPEEKLHPHYLAFPPPASPPSLFPREPESNPHNSSTIYNPPYALINTSPNPQNLALRSLRSLQKKQWSCPPDTSSCSGIGYPNSCCRLNEKCVAIEDTGSGPVGCCPAGTECNGNIGGCGNGGVQCGGNIGGGCCISGFVCAGVGSPSPPTTTTTTTTTSTTPQPTTPTPTLSSTTNQDPIAPIRPTSSVTSSPPPPPQTTDEPPPQDFCPTGYYPCLASAGGGCCQTGRDCAVTNCPVVSSTTIVNDGGVTVVIPAGGRAAPPQVMQGCASGWFECESEVGGGCCPGGYKCGQVSCVVELENGAGETGVAKVRAGESRADRVKGDFGLFGVLVGVLGIVLV